ncbi:MAG: insulinase family protein, partial [Verrucomicrobia bacterium]|nr:insulinase family protein [Verrucomicrobiota bacterium]
MKTFFSLLGTALFAGLISLPAQSAQIPLEAALPLDPNITVKKLPNGLQYYIRENQKPENRAMFRLVVNAGSLQETEDQKGLAHFLEHMAFNGTDNFEKQELVNFLERIGMRFGADLNAYTSFDETVYMLEVPMDDEEVLKTAFRVLRDWMQGISFDSEEIEKERGVVIEEWRLRRGAQGRLNDKQIPILFHESRYASRLPIGEVEIIQNAPKEEFVDFYRKWYRPNLMAIIAVGDFDSEKIEALIKSTFSDVKNPVDAPDRISHPVPDHEETLFSIETDPELQYTQLQIAYKRPPSPQGTAAAYRASIVESLYTGMLNKRLSERVQEANPPYLYGAMGKASMVRSKEVIIQTAVVKEGQFDEGLKALLLEAKRAQR